MKEHTGVIKKLFTIKSVFMLLAAIPIAYVIRYIVLLMIYGETYYFEHFFIAPAFVLAQTFLIGGICYKSSNRKVVLSAIGIALIVTLELTILAVALYFKQQ